MQNEENKNVNSQEGGRLIKNQTFKDFLSHIMQNEGRVIKNPTFDHFLSLNNERIDLDNKQYEEAGLEKPSMPIYIQNTKQIVSQGGNQRLEGGLIQKKEQESKIGFNYFYEDYTQLDDEELNNDEAKLNPTNKIESIKFIHNKYNETYLNTDDGKNLVYIDIKNDKNSVEAIFNKVGFLELKKAQDNKYTTENGGVNRVHMGYDKDNQVDTISFLPTGLKEPIYMDIGDSFNISLQGNILWCHCPVEMHKQKDTFNNIAVELILTNHNNQIFFNNDGSPKILWLSRDDQKICGLTTRYQTNNTYMRENPAWPVEDIKVYNQYEFDFYAKEGQECCGVKIDHKEPIRYKKVQDNVINLTFTNDKGEKITKVVNEKGEDLSAKCIKDLGSKINKTFTEQPNIIFDEKLRFVNGKLNGEKIDGLCIDKSSKSQFQIDSQGKITQIYRLDAKNFPLELDDNYEILDKKKSSLEEYNKYEIIYTKQADGKNFVSYYDKNGKQQILEVVYSTIDKIDGLSIDKNTPAKFIMVEKGCTTEIYKLDAKKFPFQNDGKEIIYKKQSDGKNFVSYYDKNGKQQILEVVYSIIDKIDGLSIDKNTPAKFIMVEKGGTNEIYKLDAKKFPFQNDGKEITYKKQAGGKNFVSYCDKNRKQQILQFNEFSESNVNYISYETGLYICIDNKIFKKAKNGKLEEASDMTKDMFKKLQDNDVLIHNADNFQIDEKGIFTKYDNREFYYRPTIDNTNDLVWQQKEDNYIS